MDFESEPYLFFKFTDTLCLVVAFDNGQLCIICCLWILLEQTIWVWVDTAILYSCSIFLWIYGTPATTSVDGDRASPKKSINKTLVLLLL